MAGYLVFFFSCARQCLLERFDTFFIFQVAGGVFWVYISLFLLPFSFLRGFSSRPKLSFSNFFVLIIFWVFVFATRFLVDRSSFFLSTSLLASRLVVPTYLRIRRSSNSFPLSLCSHIINTLPFPYSTFSC